MTTLNLDENSSIYQIRAFQPGMIQINDITLTKSVIISPSQLVQHWAPQSITELSAQSLKIIIDMKPDVLLIGTGSEHVFLPAEIYGELINHGIGVEVMETRAACRTFNALSAENRNVVAALIIK
jgi:uncharacterized protein